MMHVKTNTFRPTQLAGALVLAAISSGASAHSFGEPIPPNLDYLKDGAFASNVSGCFFIFRPRGAQVTKTAGVDVTETEE